MAYDSVKSIRVDQAEWEQAKKICDDLHLSMSTMVNVFIKQIIIQKGVPIGITLTPSGTESNYNEEALGGDFFEDYIADRSDEGDVYIPMNNGYSSEKEKKTIDKVKHEKYKNFADPPVEDGYIVGNGKSGNEELKSWDGFGGLFEEGSLFD